MTHPLVRRLAGWLPAVLLVPAAVVVVVRVSAVPDAQVPMREVQPLDLGTTWVYEVSDHDQPSGTRTSQVVDRQLLLTGDDVVDASAVTRSYTDYPGVGPRALTAYLSVDGNRLLQPGQLDGVTFQRLEPPAPAYEVPARTGAKFDYDGTYDDDPFAYTSEVVGVGDVEVGGHTFTGCAHWVNTIELDVEDDPDAVEVLEEWTCPGYGAVRSVDTIEAYDSEITEELVEFHGAEGDWYAEGHAPAPGGQLTSAAGGTRGFDAGRTFAVPDGRIGAGLAWTQAHARLPLEPPVSDGETVVVSDLEGQVSARSTTTGEVRWRVRLPRPVLVTPLVLGAPGASTVLVAGSDRRLWALAMDDGHARWVRELDDVPASAPTVTAAGVAVATESGSLAVLDPSDGSTVWETRLADRAHTAPAAVDDLLLVVDDSGTLTAFAADDGKVRWTRALDEGVAQGPAVADGRVLVVDGAGVLHAYAVADGDETWARGIRDVTEALSVTDDVVVVLNSVDRVSAYDLKDGGQRWTQTVEPTYTAPVVVGDEVALVTQRGRLLRLSLADGRPLERRDLPVPASDVQRGTRTRFDTDPGLVGDALVVSGVWDSAVSDTVLYAIPVRDSAPAGALLHLDYQALPGPADEPPTPDGAAVLLPSGGRLLRLDEGGTTELTAESEGLVPTPVVRDGVAYVRIDEQLLALDATTGDAAWSVAAGPAYRGGQVAVGDDTVAVGVEGTGLVSLDRATGATRWTAPVPDEFSVATPLLLPDGDVVYGGGSLTRFDGATGAPLWQAPDTFLFGPAVYGGGLVIAQAQGFESAPRLAAYDAGTGQVRWSVAQPSLPSLLGPALADGVVVAADGAGLVTARTASDGTELWRLDLGGRLAGAIAVADGRVLLAVAGTGQTLRDRDFRMLALDLRTGRFLADWEPGLMPNQSVATPIVGATPDGRLLVPTSLADLAAVEVRP